MRYSASTVKWLEICKKIKKYFVADNIGKISYLSPQNAITSNSEAKSIRLDVLAKDDRGISYDKVSEQMRKEYRILPAVIMDAIDEGLQQKAVQAARNLKQLGISIDIIVQATGLSKEEVENI